MNDVKLYLQNLKSIVLRIGLVYLFYTLTRISFYLINSSQFGVLEFTDSFRILQGGLIFDTSAIAYTNALFFLLWLFPIKPLVQMPGYQKSIDVLFIIVNIICLLLNVVDFFYYEYNLKRMTADFGHWIGESNTRQIVSSFISSHWISAFLTILAIAIFIILYNKIKKLDYKAVSTIPFYSFQFLSLSLFIVLLIGGMRGGFRYSTRPITLSNAGQYVAKSNQMPIVLNTPFSIIRTFDKKVFKEEKFMPMEEAEAIYNPIIKFDYPDDSIQKKNIVIIILESFSKEHSAYLNPDLYKSPDETYTPFLDSLMQQSFLCTNAFANGRKSIDAMPSILASIPSLEVPYVLSHNSLNEINSLASLLKPLGYSSSFFHGAPNGSMGFQAFSRIAGFDQYIGKTEFNDDRFDDGIWGIWDEEFLQFFNTKLSENKQPFLGVFFSLSSHHPYKVPEKYENSFKSGKLEVHKGIQYTDHSLKLFFEHAAKADWYKNTLFVIVADHSTIAWSEKYNTQAGAFSIPIIYYDPSNPILKNKFEHTTQQTDIMPSVLDYIRFNKPFVAFGKSVFDTTAPRIAFNYLNEHYQLINDSNSFSMSNGQYLTDVFDLKTSWVLGKNLIGKNPVDDAKTLKLHQALIQVYNYRIINNKLTNHE